MEDRVVGSRNNRSNLDSPTSVARACLLGDLRRWFVGELADARLPDPELVLVQHVFDNIDAFVRWPARAVLLWDGRCRAEKYHSYPEAIRQEAKNQRIRLDGRVNGPAIASYRLAGGERPNRIRSNNEWSVHHVYSGKFPYVGRSSTLHAARDGRHCTQSAGLVAVHPVADQMSDEYPYFAWFLRAQAFRRFGYDPDLVLDAAPHDEYGFVPGYACAVIESVHKEVPSTAA
jgi:hypothetical protein